MDDPALGLDPVARRTLLEAMILLTRDSGHTIFFSSHVLDDVERVADHVAILDRSILRASCRVDTLRDCARRIVLTFIDTPPRLPHIPGLLESQREGNELRLTLVNYSPQTEEIIAGLGAIATEQTPLTLEDIVIAYIGQRGERPLSSSGTTGSGDRHMIAIIIKEFRENLKWAALIAIAPAH